jgi:hypothetical protein
LLLGRPFSITLDMLRSCAQAVLPTLHTLPTASWKARPPTPVRKAVVPMAHAKLPPSHFATTVLVIDAFKEVENTGPSVSTCHLPIMLSSKPKQEQQD